MPDTPYSILTISALCLLFYGVSLLLTRFKVISYAGQRKFWNTLLLISILIAGGLGLLLATTVNFKINLPVTDSLLVWHVDFGIALVLIAVFHFSWHFRYYRFLISSSQSPGKANHESQLKSYSDQSENKLGFNLKRLPFSLGFTAMASQLILLREFLSVFNGNELTIGIVLANWMLLTSLGAMLSRHSPNRPGLKGIMSGLFLLGFIPILILFLLHWLRNVVLPLGGLPGMSLILIGTIVLLAPFCLLSGWLFVSISEYLSKSLDKNSISLTYGTETLGSIAGGITCSMILVFLFEPFQNLAIILLLNSVILFMVSRNEIFRIRKHFKRYLAAAVLFAFAFFVSNLDKAALQFLFPGQKILLFKDTPYGKLVVTEKDDQYNFFENNILLFTTNNIAVNEETVHYALLQRQINGNVLLIGGGISGVAGECLKYPVKRLDCIEFNPIITKLGEKFKRLPTDARFKVYRGDPLIFIKEALRNKSRSLYKTGPPQVNPDSAGYQAIILNLPEPSTLQINRFYTREFFWLCKNLLTQQGIVVLSLMPTADYIGTDALKIQSTIYQTLQSVYKKVIVIPGEKNYFLASDSELTAAVSTFAAKQGIENEYVNEFFLDDVSLKDRSEKILKRLSMEAPLNQDFEPVGCYRQLNYWLSYAGNTSLYFILIPLVLLFLLAGWRAGGITIAMFSAGLSSFSLQIIMILTFQVIYGYVYMVTGIFITVFMLGLWLGVRLARQFFTSISYKLMELLQALSLFLLLISIAYLYLIRQSELPTLLMYTIFSLLSIGMAIATGAQFHFVSVLKSGDIKTVSASGYSADLLGSATGAFVINALMVPFLGFINSLWVVASVVLLAFVLMLIKKP